MPNGWAISMKRFRIILLAVLLVGLAGRAFANPIGIMVPAYFYPGPLWISMNQAAAQVPLTAIMNPNSGPGASKDPNYVSAVNALRNAGGKVIAYIHTSYGARPIAQVEAEVDAYLTWYAIDGFFVDEMSDDTVTAHLNYYSSLYQYIKGKSATLSVTGNPGTNTAENYLTLPAADNVVIFEDGSGYASFAPSSWVTNHLARQFTHILYSIPDAATMKSDISLAASRNAGWVYVTDDGGSNPYDTLPSYWTTQVSFVQSLNQALPATKLKTTGFSSGIPNLQISGAPGTYEIQAATDLNHWTSLSVVYTSSGTTNFSDSAAVNFTSRFYRVAQ